MVKIEDVFGVSNKQVKSYIQRDHVDDKFIEALRSDKQIIVFGSSKQGKSALVKKHVKSENSIVVSLSPKSTLKDIYQSILRKSDVILSTTYSEGVGTTSKVGGKARIQGAIALILKGTVETSIEKGNTKSRTDNYEKIEFNLELPDDVADIINRAGKKKVIILENFHYLPEALQKEFAFDLRTFQDLKVRFIIVGVWKESNRLSQFNGELQDRIDEIAVEPWDRNDFKRIIEKGEAELNIKLSSEVVEACVNNSFNSVGIFQELLRLTCINSGGVGKKEHIDVDSIEAFQSALKEKSDDYADRHLKNLESIASGNSTSIQKGKPLPFWMHYYIVKVILEQGYNGIKNGGLSKSNLMNCIKKMHHRKDDLKGGHLTAALKGLPELQSKKNINPPVMVYDSTLQQLKVIDFTFFYFLKNADLNIVSDEIINPIDIYE